jgi:hypothetical protein
MHGSFLLGVLEKFAIMPKSASGLLIEDLNVQTQGLRGSSIVPAGKPEPHNANRPSAWL